MHLNLITPNFKCNSFVEALEHGYSRWKKLYLFIREYYKELWENFDKDVHGRQNGSYLYIEETQMGVESLHP